MVADRLQQSTRAISLRALLFFPQVQRDVSALGDLLPNDIVTLKGLLDVGSPFRDGLIRQHTLGVRALWTSIRNGVDKSQSNIAGRVLTRSLRTILQKADPNAPIETIDAWIAKGVNARDGNKETEGNLDRNGGSDNGAEGNTGASEVDGEPKRFVDAGDFLENLLDSGAALPTEPWDAAANPIVVESGTTAKITSRWSRAFGKVKVVNAFKPVANT